VVFCLKRAGEEIAPRVPDYVTMLKAFYRGHNTCSYKLADRGELLRVVLRSTRQLQVKKESES